MTDDQSEQRHARDVRPGQPDGETDARFVVVTPEGMGVAPAHAGERGEGTERGSAERGAAADDRRERTNPAELVEEPAKVMRIGSMIKQLLEEVRGAPLDEPGRRRLAEIHHRSVEELKEGLAPELVEELDRLALPFTDGSPSDPELRIAHAQLVGWLEGLFHGIQTALMAQQMATQHQLQQMRALPPGAGTSYGQPPGAPPPAGGEPSPTGQYL